MPISQFLDFWLSFFILSSVSRIFLWKKNTACAKALIDFSGLFKLFNSLPLLGFLLPNRIFQKIEISQKPSFVGNFRWNEGVIKGFWTFTYGQIGLWKFFFFMIFFRFECDQDCWRKGLLPQARLEPTPLKFRVSLECH